MTATALAAPPPFCEELGQGRVRLNMHPGQVRMWESDARFVFAIAGTQSGKTVFGPWWLNREIERLGENDYLAVTATYDLFHLKMQPALEHVFCDLLDWGVWLAKDRAIMSRHDRSRILLRSADAEGGLEAATAGAAWLDECGQDRFDRGAWEAVQRRLSLSQGRVLGTTTPYNFDWLQTDVFDRWRGGDTNYDVIQFASDQNPVFPRGEFERARATLPSWKFDLFYRGQLVRPAGLIYSDYSDSQRELGGHVVRPFPIPATWPRFVGVDFGPVNAAMIWLAEEHDVQRDDEGEVIAHWPTGTYYAYRHTVGGGRTGPELARDALEYHEPVSRWFGGSHSETAQRRDWQAAHCPVMEPTVVDPEAGIDRVIGLLKQKRLFVFDSLGDLRREFATYSRELDDAGKPTLKIANREQFHALDALRAVATAFPLERPEPRLVNLELPDDTRKVGALAARLHKVGGRQDDWTHEQVQW